MMGHVMDKNDEPNLKHAPLFEPLANMRRNRDVFYYDYIQLMEGLKDEEEE